MTADIAIIFITGFAIAAGLFGGVFLWLAAKLKSRVNHQQAIIADLENDLRALCAGAVGLGGRIDRIEDRWRRLSERQEQLELRENSSERPYAQAIRMVHKGADVEEITSVCGLSKGEAELVLMMHRLEEAS